MAKRSKKRKKRRIIREKWTERGYQYISSRRLLRPPSTLLDTVTLDDKRRFPHDDRVRDWLESTVAVSATIRDKKGKPVKLSQSREEFKRPYKVNECRRRRSRRETLFSLRRIGRGIGGGFKRKVFTWRSLIRC